MCSRYFYVFFSTLTLVIIRTGAKTPICFMCFCLLCAGVRSHRQCVLCVFVLSAQVSGNKSYRWKHVTTPHVFSVFLCFYFTFKFSQNSNGGKTQMCFIYFCVMVYRSEVTPPMCFVCCCVFITGIM